MNTFRFYVGELKDLVKNSTRTQRDVALAVVIVILVLYTLF